MTLEKVATPLTALTVIVLLESKPAGPVTARLTAAVLLVGLPYASNKTTVITGRADPAVVRAGWSTNCILTGAPGATEKGEVVTGWSPSAVAVIV